MIMIMVAMMMSAMMSLMIMICRICNDNDMSVVVLIDDILYFIE